MLININKLKPYKFIEDKTLQHILTKPSDLVIYKPIQTKEPEPLPIKLEYFQPIEFEPFNNLLAHGSIKGTNVFVHYYVMCLLRKIMQLLSIIKTMHLIRPY